MRAWQVQKHGEPGDALKLVEAELPEPGPGQLRIEVAAAALGLPDVFMCRGSYPLTPALPFTPGQELVGTVTAVGKGASAQLGERVMGVSMFYTGHGGFAEQALLSGDFAFPAPSSLRDEEAAGFVIPYHTAYIGLVRRALLRAGETLLVLGGSGGTGSAAIKLGAALGAEVIATASGEERVAFCRALGARVVIDRRVEDIATAVKQATDGRGANVIYDPVGGDGFDAATKSIAHEGRLLAVGFASGRWGQVSAEALAFGNYSVVGLIPSRYDREFRLAAQQELLALHDTGAIAVPVGRTSPFEELPAALADVAAGRVMGKSILTL